MINETIETWKAIVTMIQFFCLGGSLFCENETMKSVLQGIVAVCFVVAFVGF